MSFFPVVPNFSGNQTGTEEGVEGVGEETGTSAPVESRKASAEGKPSTDPAAAALSGIVNAFSEFEPQNGK